MPSYLNGSRSWSRVDVYGIGFDRLREEDVARHVVAELAAGRGGQIVTPNVDILRRVRRDRESMAYVESASLVVADGTPLIWASRIAGNPLPGRVAGSDLIWSLSSALAEQGRSIYLLGGAPGTSIRAEKAMRSRFPHLRIAGHLSPPFGFDGRPDQFEAACAAVVAARPDLVYVGLGFPKQERVIARIRPLLNTSWFLGCGAAIDFMAGVHRRAPLWMQRSGLEWAHRLASEPTRLMRRYLLHDFPFALELLAMSARLRLRRSLRTVPTDRLSVASDGSLMSAVALPASRTVPESEPGTAPADVGPPASTSRTPADPLAADQPFQQSPIQAGEQV